MNTTEIYFDNASSTPLSQAAINAGLDILVNYPGNPSAGHKQGRLAGRRLKDARAGIAALLNAPENDVYFTSGGTEANCLAILGAVKRPGLRIITSKAEHPSVIACFKELKTRGTDTVFLQPDKDGHISADDIKASINDRTVLVSLMHVNNETGVLSDIENISKIIKSAAPDILFHVDAVQGFGKHPINMRKWGADMVSVSAHKLHGPSGTGAMYVRSAAANALKPLLFGGHQERGVRPGTENIAGICAFQAAAEETVGGISHNLSKVSAVKERLLRIPGEIDGVYINGAGNISPYILNMSFVGVKSEILQNALDSRGIYVSAGAACNSSEKSPENAVFAYGLGRARAESAIRVSLSRNNTPEEAEIFVETLKEILPTIKRSGV